MKKVLVFILALVYLAASAGATVHMHYCMGDLAGWSFTDKGNDHCGVCGMKKSTTNKKGCCNDEHRQFKLQQDQNAAALHFIINPVTAVISSPVYLPANTGNFTSIAEERPLTNSPPPCSSIPVYLSNRNFRI